MSTPSFSSAFLEQSYASRVAALSTTRIGARPSLPKASEVEASG